MSTRPTWRERAHEVIAAVIREHPDVEGPALRKLISAAYPFGERAMHPYKIWLDEVKRTLEWRAVPKRGPDPAKAREEREAAGQGTLL